MTYRVRVTLELQTEAEPDANGSLSSDQVTMMYGECRAHGDEVGASIEPVTGPLFAGELEIK